MQYALLIYADEATGLPEQLPENSSEKFRLEAEAVIEEMRRAGVFVSSLRLADHGQRHHAALAATTCCGPPTVPSPIRRRRSGVSC